MVIVVIVLLLAVVGGGLYGIFLAGRALLSVIIEWAQNWSEKFGGMHFPSQRNVW